MKKHTLFFTGMLAVALAFGLVLTGCDNTDDGSYKFKLKVDNNTLAVIPKVEFINGDNQNDKVVATLSNASLGRSAEYSQSGFTVESGSSRRVLGVKVTYANGYTYFNYSAYGHEAKVLVSLSGSYPSFSDGNW